MGSAPLGWRRARHSPRALARLGALAFLLRPTYVLTEVVTAAATRGGYSFVSDSVSRLGEVGCSPDYCSPRHAVMNGSFVGYGALLAGGAVLHARPLARGSPACWSSRA